MVLHDLKTWPRAFQLVADGRKRFEIRKNDRNFQVGDALVLREWDPDMQEYTGRSVNCIVSCIIQGEYGLPADLCVMGIE